MSINTVDKSLIEEKAYSWSHNFQFFSMVYGEPYFLDGTIYYYDGELLTINTCFLPASPDIPTNNPPVLESIINHINPNSILLVGPVQNLSIANLGWRLEKHLIINVQTDVTLELDRSSCDFIETDNEYSIQVRVCHGNSFTSEHVKLIEGFLDKGRSIDDFDRLTYLTVLPWIIISHPVVIEARHEFELVGFALLDFSLPNLPTCLCISGRNNSIVTSAINHFMINYCLQHGYRRVNLGCFHEDEKQVSIIPSENKFNKNGLVKALWCKPGLYLSNTRHKPWITKSILGELFT